MRQFHFFCKQRYLKYTVLSLLLCPLSSSAAEEWKDVKGESTTKIVESTQQKKQKRVITGVVRDGDTNEPIIGASVWLKNSSVGAVTDIDGKYSITIEGVGGVLEFSYIGMKKQEIAIIDQKSINVTLQPDTEVLDEVVVVGYGSQKKERKCCWGYLNARHQETESARSINFKCVGRSVIRCCGYDPFGRARQK